MLEHSPSPFSTLPPEILTEIAFELSCLQPLGPPSILLPLLQSCGRICDVLSSGDNPALWARIFRYKFDARAIQRRALTPKPEQCTSQLVKYCRAMQTLRAADRYAGYGVQLLEPLPDVGIEEALQTALLMMYEDDGKNSRQLLEWANLFPLVQCIVRTRAYDNSRSNNGWARESRVNACALWLMWMTTSEKSLNVMPEGERLQLITALLPFVLFPYRYPVAEAPPNYFHLPLDLPTHITTPSQVSTIHTAHGPYPVFPSTQRTITDDHYSARPLFTIPLMSPAARLLFFALSEVTPAPIPAFLARNRAEWLERGRLEILPTREALEEFNWGWYARPPLGSGRPDCDESADGEKMGNPWWWTWGVGDDRSLTFGEETIPGEGPGQGSATCLTSRSRWEGKAPHRSQMACFRAGMEKSMMWDADWWRMRLCGDPARPPMRIPYGRVYEPGCMDGFWQGRMVTPGQSELQALLGNPTRPEEFTQDSLGVMFHFLFVQFREAHAIVGVDHGDTLDIGVQSGDMNVDADEEIDNNMNNAWFVGESGSTVFRVDRNDNIEIVATDETGRLKRASFPAWTPPGRRRSFGLGNDALSEELVGGDVEPSWKGYEHDDLACEECLARQRLQRQEAARRKSENHGGSGRTSAVGSGTESEDEGDQETQSGSVMSDDTLEDWDPDSGDVTDPAGNVHPSLPTTHDREMLAKGRCAGIRDIFLIGETPKRHGDAFNHFVYYGRVRTWDGLIAILRKPKHREDGHLGIVLFYGYLVGDENFVGSWRITSVDPALPAWEGAFVMSRRTD